MFFFKFSGAATPTLILYLVAKFAESAAFLIIYPFAAELYPTEVRGIGIGFSAYMGGLGLVVIPFINYLVSLKSYSNLYWTLFKLDNLI